MRLQNFSAQALDNPKLLYEGNDLYNRLGDALLAYDPATAEEVASTGMVGSTREARREALAVHGIFRDQATITAYCFGPLVYRKSGRDFEHVAGHAALGECVPLCLQQLRGSEVIRRAGRAGWSSSRTRPRFSTTSRRLRGAGRRELIICARGAEQLGRGHLVAPGRALLASAQEPTGRLCARR